MAKQLRSYSVQELLHLRDEIGAVLSSKAKILRDELAALGSDMAEVGRIAIFGKAKKSLAGRKAAVKYRDPKTGETWSGRGAMAGWLAAHVKAGKKAEKFLISARPSQAKKTKKVGRPVAAKTSKRGSKRSDKQALTPVAQPQAE